MESIEKKKMEKLEEKIANANGIDEDKFRVVAKRMQAAWNALLIIADEHSTMDPLELADKAAVIASVCDDGFDCAEDAVIEAKRMASVIGGRLN